jgi:hypothetical protein
MDSLADISKNVAIQNVKITDTALATYIKSAVKHIEGRGEKLEDYALTQVGNPMEFVEGGYRVTQQWRLVEISKLQNLPTYEEEL